MALLVGACLTTAVAGALAFSAVVLRDSLQAEARERDTQAARLLALAIAAVEADPKVADGVLASAFDASRHARIRLVDPQGRVLVDLPRAGNAQAPKADAAPPVAETPVVAPVALGSRVVGEVQVFRHPAAELSTWRDAVALLALGLAALGLTLSAVLAIGLQRGRQDLRRLAQAVHRLGRGEPLPGAPEVRGELAPVGGDLLAASQRLLALKEQVALQSEAVDRAAQTDALTGLYNRVHFRTLLQQALESEPPAPVMAGGSLLIVRLRRLDAMNLRVGYEKVDGLVRALAGVANAYPARVAGAFAGRLNGGDIGLYLPVPGVALSTAEAIWAVMHTTLSKVDPAADIAIGGVEGLPWGSASRALAAADEALARAEAQGAFAIVVTGPPEELVRDAVPGDGSWRQRIGEALESAHVRLRESPVLTLDGALIHLDAQLQFRIEAGGAFEDARPRLALQIRSLLTRRVDLAALSLALKASATDGAARCVRLALPSLEEPDFLQEATRLLESDPAGASRLRLEVSADPPAVQRWLHSVPTWRHLGVRLGAAASEGPLEAWAEAAHQGLHQVSLPLARLREVADDPIALAAWREGLSTLHATGLMVLAREVEEAGSLPMLKDLGVGGFEGPAAGA